MNLLAEHPHGYFADIETGLPSSAEVIYAKWCVRSRDMILTKAVLYVDPQGNEHLVQEGERINGLTVPRMFWRICWPYEPMTRDASVIHDHLCRLDYSWKYSAWVFYHAMRARGVGPVRAWIRWAAVRYVGVLFRKSYLR